MSIWCPLSNFVKAVPDPMFEFVVGTESLEEQHRTTDEVLRSASSDFSFCRISNLISHHSVLRSARPHCVAGLGFIPAGIFWFLGVEPIAAQTTNLVF
jgi:hypothetical protein